MVEFKVIQGATGAGAEPQPERCYVTGISLAGFLQLLHLERKTCCLKVSTGGRTGFLYFERGEMTAAHLDGVEGLDAAYQFVLWDDPEIEVEYGARGHVHNVAAPLSKILLEAVRRKDEAARPAESSPAAVVAAADGAAATAPPSMKTPSGELPVFFDVDLSSVERKPPR